MGFYNVLRRTAFRKYTRVEIGPQTTIESEYFSILSAELDHCRSRGMRWRHTVGSIFSGANFIAARVDFSSLSADSGNASFPGAIVVNVAEPQIQPIAAPTAGVPT